MNEESLWRLEKRITELEEKLKEQEEDLRKVQGKQKGLGVLEALKEKPQEQYGPYTSQLYWNTYPSQPYWGNSTGAQINAPSSSHNPPISTVTSSLEGDDVSEA